MASALGSVRIVVHPDIEGFSAKLLAMLGLIVLTHADDGSGEYVHSGRVLVDPERIESIEECKLPDGRGTVSYLTMRSGRAHTVMETPEQIHELVADAAKALADALGHVGT